MAGWEVYAGAQGSIASKLRPAITKKREVVSRVIPGKTGIASVRATTRVLAYVRHDAVDDAVQGLWVRAGTITNMPAQGRRGLKVNRQFR